MAKAQTGGGKLKDEALQIGILTTFMLGGFLALSCAFLYVYFIPSKESSLNAQVNDWNSMAALLDPQRKTKDSKEIWELRERFNEATKNPVTESLHSIVQKNLGDLQFNSFPRMTSRQPNPRSPTVEHKQDIDLREAPLKEFLLFIARVQQENPGLQVGHTRLSRKVTRSGIAPPSIGGSSSPEDDKWTAQIDFYAFGTKESPPGAKTAPKAEEGTEAGAEAGPAEAVPGEETPKAEAPAEAPPAAQ